MSSDVIYPDVVLEGVRLPGSGVVRPASRSGDVVVGESLVRGLDTAFRGYFPPLKYRKSSDGGRDLRGFVQSILHDDDGLAVLAEGGEKEMTRLANALTALDNFRTESPHYSWKDFIALLGRELDIGDGGLGARERGQGWGRERGTGLGAVYEEGRGFVVPGEDFGRSLVEQTAPLIDQATRALEAMSVVPPAEGDTREDLLQRLRQTNPDEYLDGGGATTGEGVGQASGMDIDDQHGAAEEASASAAVEEEAFSSGVQGDTDDLDAVLRSKDEEIAAIERQLAALKTSTRGDSGGAGPPPRETAGVAQSHHQQTSWAATAAPPALVESSRWRSELQASEDVEKRMAVKAAAQKQQQREEMDTFGRKGPLSQEQEREVDDAFNGGSDLEVLVKAFNADLTRRDMKCLRPYTWLNDEVVNMYMQLLAVRDKELCKANPNRRPSHFMSSFFLAKLKGNDGKYNYKGVRRWTRKVKVFEMDKIFVPVNVSNSHWCMAVIYMQKKRIKYYDSMGGGGKSVTDALLLWLEDEDEDKNGDDAIFEPDDWKTVGTDVATTPQQENGSDCGAFAVSFASYVSDDLPFDFRQADITQMRRRMVWSLLKQQLV